MPSRLLDTVLLPFRPARWSVDGYRFVPLLLLAAGVWAVVQGSRWHRIPVSQTHEETISIAVPVERPFPPPMPAFSGTDPFGQPTDGSQPPLDPSAGPPVALGTPEALGPPIKFIQATKSVTTTTDEGELSVNRAVSIRWNHSPAGANLSRE